MFECAEQIRTGRRRRNRSAYRHQVRAAVVRELQLIEGLGERARVVRVGEEEPPVHGRPGGGDHVTFTSSHAPFCFCHLSELQQVVLAFPKVFYKRTKVWKAAGTHWSRMM